MQQTMAGIKDSLKLESQEKQIGLNRCEVHGKNFEYVTCSVDGYQCPDCYKEQREIEKKQFQIIDAFRNLDLPERLRGCSFENYTPKTVKAREVKKRCEEFVTNHKNHGGMILLGGVGTGKTHLAASVCNCICLMGIKCVFTTVPRIIREIRSSWGSKNKKDRWSDSEEITEQMVVDHYATTPVLVIDEIGSQYGTESEKIIVSELINDRYNNLLPTIITGNITMSEAESYLGERAIDRIKDNGNVLIFDWESHRKERK